MVPGDVDTGYVISRFLVRRLLAFAYSAAFLSLLSQVDGLFGCGGLYRSNAGAGPALPLFLCCNVGAALASAALLGARPLERQPVIAFLALWALYATSVSLAAPVLPALEDKLLLEVGLACVPLVARDGVGGGRVGRALAAWIVFRGSFASASEQFGGECSAWRQLTAFGSSYQLTAFPMPLAWPVSQAPLAIIQSVTFLHLYANTVVALLLVLPWRCMATPAVLLQLALTFSDTLLANHGVSSVCRLALTCALLSDWWHRIFWSKGVLEGWGCKLPPAAAAASNSDDSRGSCNGNIEGGTKFYHLLAPLGIISGYGLALSVLARGPATLDDLLVPLGLGSSAEALQRTICGGAILGSVLVFFTLLSAVLRAPGLRSLTALLVWASGSVQLARDAHLSDLFIGQVGSALATTGQLLEAAHVAHRLAPEMPCPRQEGRTDIVFQGTRLIEDQSPDAPPQPILDLSSKLLPRSAEQRPTWFQPYSPRLEQELWRFARHTGDEFPLWAEQLAAGLALRKGSGARLAVGHWDGIGAKLYAIVSQVESQLLAYSKLETPLSAIRVLSVTHKFVEDKHSNKWWNLTEAEVLKLYTGENLDKLLEKHGSALAGDCAERFPWEGLPVAEAMLALMCLSLLGTVLFRSGGGKSSDGKKAKSKSKSKKA